MKHVNIPTGLTLLRLIVSPLVLPLLIVYLGKYNFFWVNMLLAFIFVLLSLTDFFDGYLARKLDQETEIGKALDPIADKFLVYSTLIALLAVGKIYFYWVVLLIGRDFFMMGLRQIALERDITVSVSYLGKIKTAFQMIFLTFVIINPYQALWFSGNGLLWNGIEAILLGVTLFLSLYSAQKYGQFFMQLWKAQHQEPSQD